MRLEDKGLLAIDEAVDVVKRLKTVGPALEALQVRICVRGVWCFLDVLASVWFHRLWHTLWSY